ncbi:PhoD-like phosphatase-domain-containing protein [Aspergillus alliaceus]|uniref:PhoD-like phosphatase-domain-containing protein n=1 Tax=Petromyces alliaceus TaxID=209559 RepID=A0A5N7CC91_PETAA|nr:PhoD-like phosphatase-domain-containing protein [Aspergillus alliaceus]
MYTATLLSLLALSTGTWASYNANLNYRSPSTRHTRMGIDVDSVHRRSLAKRDKPRFHPSQLNFTHGVASGDPYADSVILWTRVAPSLESDMSEVTVSGTVGLYSHNTEPYIKASAHPICVDYRVYEDKERHQVVDKGRAYTTSDIDYTLKVEATGLKPFTTYWYQFQICNSNITSPIGRTKTAPGPDDATEEIKLAVYSCSNYPSGYFNAYGNVVRKDSVDYVLHLGDYIYETRNGIVGTEERAVLPERDIFTLYDYRTRLGFYRTDLDLVASHQNFAWIPVWDDHEIADNGYRDGFSHLNNTEESFRNDGPHVSVDQRKMNAVRAYFEWMPLRQVDMDDGLRIWRSFKMGNLFDLIMLDTRHYDRSITDLSNLPDWNTKYIEEIQNDAGRTLMGGRQETWFEKQLTASNARRAKWRIIGSQVRFARLGKETNGKVTYNMDAWEGYRANQNRTLKHLYDNNIGNNIMIAGDTHVNWVSDIAWIGEKPYDNKTGAGSIGVEFAGTAVSSTGFGGTISSAEKIAASYAANDDLQWNEGYYRGYFELHLRQDEVEAKYFGCPTVATRNSWELPLANFTVKHGDSHLTRPIAGGHVEAGYIHQGEVKHSNLTLNTETGQWQVVGFDQMFVA